ncbi:MAG TPA: FAD-dependent oxidoreductase [Geminicoccaceae bacterium]|nr:FAD-dependent oxidoreductase [Geminicoccaceae bacterium]
MAVTTPKGTLRCRAAVLTLPVSLLAREAIRFTPALPQAKLAAAGLPMGHIAKLLLAVEGCPFDVEPDTQAVGSLRSARTTIYHLEPLGRPLVEAYWSGSLALELEQAGLPAMVDFALAELAGLFGSGVRRRLRPLLVSTWAADPYSRGAYSHARPGRRRRPRRTGGAARGPPVLRGRGLLGRRLLDRARGVPHRRGGGRGRRQGAQALIGVASKRDPRRRRTRWAGQRWHGGRTGPGTASSTSC